MANKAKAKAKQSKVGPTLKSSSKITLGLILRVGLIIGETR